MQIGRSHIGNICKTLQNPERNIELKGYYPVYKNLLNKSSQSSAAKIETYPNNAI